MAPTEKASSWCKNAIGIGLGKTSRILISKKRIGLRLHKIEVNGKQCARKACIRARKKELRREGTEDVEVLLLYSPLSVKFATEPSTGNKTSPDTSARNHVI